MNSHVDLWIKVNRRTIFKLASEKGDELRACFPKARASFAEENNRMIGKELDMSKAVTWR